MGEEDGAEELEGILEARGEAVRQPNGLVPPPPFPRFREFSKKRKRIVRRTVNVNEQQCEKQGGEEEREGYSEDTKGVPENTEFRSEQLRS